MHWVRSIRREAYAAFRKGEAMDRLVKANTAKERRRASR